MKTLRSVICKTAVNPAMLDETLSGIHPMLLDMDLDSTFILAYNLQDVHYVSNLMNVSVTDEQAHRVLNIMLDNYDPNKGINFLTMQEVISEVLSTSV